MARIYKEELIEKNNYYDVIVVGGGHAGIEASLAPARLGLNTLMICGNIKKIGNMPCNPSIGGTGKGQERKSCIHLQGGYRRYRGRNRQGLFQEGKSADCLQAYSGTTS